MVFDVPFWSCEEGGRYTLLSKLTRARKKHQIIFLPLVWRGGITVLISGLKIKMKKFTLLNPIRNFLWCIPKGLISLKISQSPDRSPLKFPNNSFSQLFLSNYINLLYYLFKLICLQDGRVSLVSKFEKNLPVKRQFPISFQSPLFDGFQINSTIYVTVINLKPFFSKHERYLKIRSLIRELWNEDLIWPRVLQGLRIPKNCRVTIITPELPETCVWQIMVRYWTRDNLRDRN